MRLSTSLSMLRATPGYWIFMAALRPSCRVAPCTCAPSLMLTDSPYVHRSATRRVISRPEGSAQLMECCKVACELTGMHGRKAYGPHPLSDARKVSWHWSEICNRNFQKLAADLAN